MKRYKTILSTAVYALAALLFAAALSWFTWALMGVSNPPVLRNLPFYIAGTAFLVLLSRSRKLFLGLLLLLLLWAFVTWPENPESGDLPFLWRIGREVVDSFRWGLTLNAYKGAMPVSFSKVLAASALLLSMPLVYWFSFAPGALLLLAAPLFFIPELSMHPHWQRWLWTGLLAIGISLYRPRERTKTDWPHPAVLAGLLLVAFLLQSFIAPDDLFHSGLSRKINEINDTRTGRIHGSFSLSRTGYTNQSGILGGPVQPTDTPMLDVSGQPYPYYLRGSVYYEFDENRWIRPSLSDAMILEDPDRLLSDDPDVQALGYSILPLLDTFESQGLLHQTLIEQHPRVDNLHTVFSPGFVFRIKSITELPQDPDAFFEYWQNNDETNRFRFTKEGIVFSDQPYEDGILLHGVAANAAALRSRFETLGAFRPVRTEAAYAYRDLVRTRDPLLYTLVYEELTEALTRDDTYYTANVLVRIRDHFQTSYPYTLTPDPIPADSSILPYFLETKTGYCVYYASLTTELLQDVGIHARYAEGFVAPAADGDEIVTVTGQAGHAWTEIEYENAGWIMYETTPAVQMDYLEGRSALPDEDVPDSFDDTIEPQTPREQTERPERPEQTEPRELPEEEVQPHPVRTLLYSVRRPLAILLFLVAWHLWRARVFALRHNEVWLKKQYGARPEVLVERIFRDIQNLAKLENTKFSTRTPRDTLLTLAQQYSVRDIAMVTASVVLLERTLYGERVPAYNELAPLIAFHRSLENRVRAYMPTFEWYLKRWLWSRFHPL